MSLENKENMNHFDILLSDLFEVLKRKKVKIVLLSIFFMLLAFFLAATRDINYYSEGSFRDKGKADVGLGHSVTDLIFGASSEKKDSETVSVLKSSKVMESLVKRKGLQGSIQEKELTYGFINNFWKNLVVEWAYFKNKKTPVLSDPKIALSFSNLQYPGEFYKSLELTFLDEERYQVKGGQIGKINRPYEDEDFVFTLKKESSDSLQNRSFNILLNPLKAISKDLSTLLTAKIDSDDRTLIRIKYYHPERQQAAEFINELMATYQDYLEEEQKRVASRQLDYLEKRENEIAFSLKKIMEEHAENLGQDLLQNGFVDSDKEVEFLSGQLISSNQKLMDIALDEKRLGNVLTGEVATFDPYRTGTDATIINEILQKIRELKMGQDSLELALVDNETSTNTYKLAKDFKTEFRGITLPTTKELYVGLSHDRQANETARRQLDFVIDQMDSPDFEITSLTSVLSDPVSLDKIQKASNSSHALKDLNNRTGKELERLRDELLVQKSFLKSHLTETSKMLNLKGTVLDEKNFRLQNTMLDLSVRESKLLVRQLKDFITVRLQNLGHEKGLIQQRVQEIKTRLADIPQKWMKEQFLEQHLNRNERMVENIASMVESKNISNNLELIQSAPLDFAVPALHPKRPQLILFSIVGAILGAFFACAGFVTTSLFKAMPLTLSNLSSNGFKVIGELSYKKKDKQIPLFDSNLNTLRRALGFLPSQNVMLINFYGKGINFSEILGALLRKKGEKVLRLNLNFNEIVKGKKEAPSGPGLKQYLDGTAPLDEVLKNDTLLAGGTERFSAELLSQTPFKNLLEELKLRYSWIVASSPAPLSSAEAQILLQIFDAALIGIKDETLEDLRPLLNDVKSFEDTKPVAFFKFKTL